MSGYLKADVFCRVITGGDKDKTMKVYMKVCEYYRMLYPEGKDTIRDRVKILDLIDIAEQNGRRVKKDNDVPYYAVQFKVPVYIRKKMVDKLEEHYGDEFKRNSYAHCKVK